MTKKDFELIARVLRTQYDSYTPAKDTHKAAAIGDTIRMFAAELSAINPRFDRERFVAACMGEDS